MKHNLEHFSEIMNSWYSQIPEEMRTEDKFLKLTSHKGEDFKRIFNTKNGAGSSDYFVEAFRYFLHKS